MSACKPFSHTISSFWVSLILGGIILGVVALVFKGERTHHINNAVRYNVIIERLTKEAEEMVIPPAPDNMPELLRDLREEVVEQRATLGAAEIFQGKYWDEFRRAKSNDDNMRLTIKILIGWIIFWSAVLVYCYHQRRVAIRHIELLEATRSG